MLITVSLSAVGYIVITSNGFITGTKGRFTASHSLITSNTVSITVYLLTVGYVCVTGDHVVLPAIMRQ